MGKEPPEELKLAIFKNWLDTRPKMEMHESVRRFGRSKCHFLALENGHFWWGRLLVHAFPFSGEYQAIFWKLQILAPLGAFLPLWLSQTQKWTAGYRLWVYNSENWFLGSPYLWAQLVFWAAKKSKVGQKRNGLLGSVFPVHSLGRILGTHPRAGNIDNAPAMMQSGSLMIYCRQAKCQNNGCNMKIKIWTLSTTPDRKSFDGKHAHGIPLNMKCIKNRRSLLLVKTLQKETKGISAKTWWNTDWCQRPLLSGKRTGL